MNQFRSMHCKIVAINRKMSITSDLVSEFLSRCKIPEKGLLIKRSFMPSKLASGINHNSNSEPQGLIKRSDGNHVLLHYTRGFQILNEDCTKSLDFRTNTEIITGFKINEATRPARDQDWYNGTNFSLDEDDNMYVISTAEQDIFIELVDKKLRAKARVLPPPGYRPTYIEYNSVNKEIYLFAYQKETNELKLFIYNKSDFSSYFQDKADVLTISLQQAESRMKNKEEIDLNPIKIKHIKSVDISSMGKGYNLKFIGETENNEALLLNNKENFVYRINLDHTTTKVMEFEKGRWINALSYSNGRYLLREKQNNICTLDKKGNEVSRCFLDKDTSSPVSGIYGSFVHEFQRFYETGTSKNILIDFLNTLQKTKSQQQIEIILQRIEHIIKSNASEHCTEVIILNSLTKKCFIANKANVLDSLLNLIEIVFKDVVAEPAHLENNLAVLNKIILIHIYQLPKMLQKIKNLYKTDTEQHSSIYFLYAMLLAGQRALEQDVADELILVTDQIQSILNNDNTQTPLQNKITTIIRSLSTSEHEYNRRDEVFPMVQLMAKIIETKKDLTTKHFEEINSIVKREYKDNPHIISELPTFIKNLSDKVPLSICLKLYESYKSNKRLIEAYKKSSLWQHASSIDLSKHVDTLTLRNMHYDTDKTQSYTKQVSKTFTSLLNKIEEFANVNLTEINLIMKQLKAILEHIDKYLSKDIDKEVQKLMDEISGCSTTKNLLEFCINFNSYLCLRIIDFDIDKLDEKTQNTYWKNIEEIEEVFIPWINNIKRKTTIEFNWQPFVKLIILSYLNRDFYHLKFDPLFNLNKYEQNFSEEDFEQIQHFFDERLYKKSILSQKNWHHKQVNKQEIFLGSINDTLTNLWTNTFDSVRRQLTSSLQQLVDYEESDTLSKKIAHYTKMAQLYLKLNKATDSESEDKLILEIAKHDSKKAQYIRDQKEKINIQTHAINAYEHAKKEQNTYAVASMLKKIFDKQTGLEPNIQKLKQRLSELMNKLKEHSEDIDIPSIENISILTHDLKGLKREFKKNHEIMKIIEQGLALTQDLKNLIGYIKNVSNSLQSKMELIGESEVQHGYFNRVNNILNGSKKAQSIQVNQVISANPVDVLKALSGECLDYQKGSNGYTLIDHILSPSIMVSYHQGINDKIIYANEIVLIAKLADNSQTLALDRQFGYYGSNYSAWLSSLDNLVNLANREKISLTIPEAVWKKMGINHTELIIELAKRFPEAKIDYKQIKLSFHRDMPNEGYTDIGEKEHNAIVIYQNTETLKDVFIANNISVTNELLENINTIISLESTCDIERLKSALKRFIPLFKIHHPKKKLILNNGLLFKLSNPDLPIFQVMANAMQSLMTNEQLVSDYSNEDDWFTASTASSDIRNMLISEVGTNKQILSIGPNKGVVESELMQFRNTVYGIELNAENARKARDKGIRVITGDAHNTERILSDHNMPTKYDKVLFIESLGDLNIRTMLNNVANLLNKKGEVLILDYLPIDKQQQVDLGYERVSAQTMAKMADEAGLVLLADNTFFWKIEDLENSLNFIPSDKAASDGLVFYRLIKKAH